MDQNNYGTSAGRIMPSVYGFPNIEDALIRVSHLVVVVIIILIVFLSLILLIRRRSLDFLKTFIYISFLSGTSGFIISIVVRWVFSLVFISNLQLSYFDLGSLNTPPTYPQIPIYNYYFYELLLTVAALVITSLIASKLIGKHLFHKEFTFIEWICVSLFSFSYLILIALFLY